MDRTEFLKKISSMNREEIQEMLNNKVKRIKKIYPAVIISSKKDKGDNNDSRRNNKRDSI